MQIKGSKYTIFGTHHKPLLFLKRFIADEVTTDILLVNKITHTHTHTHTHTYIYIYHVTQLYSYTSFPNLREIQIYVYI